jgi:hypothetical protein
MAWTCRHSAIPARIPNTHFISWEQLAPPPQHACVQHIHICTSFQYIHLPNMNIKKNAIIPKTHFFRNSLYQLPLHMCSPNPPDLPVLFTSCHLSIQRRREFRSHEWKGKLAQMMRKMRNENSAQILSTLKHPYKPPQYCRCGHIP